MQSQNDFKICCKCQTLKHIDLFSKSAREKDGLQKRCKECNRIYRQSNASKIKQYLRDYYNENREVLRVKQKEYRVLHGQENSSRAKKWYYENKEKATFARKKYSGKHTGLIRGIKSRYKKTEKGKISSVLSCNKRRANIKNTISSFSKEQWIYANDFFKNQCCYCGDKGHMTLDHIIPISKNGNHTAYNVLPSCIKCNTSKNNKNYEDWYTPHNVKYSLDRENKIKDYLNDIYIKYTA